MGRRRMIECFEFHIVVYILGFTEFALLRKRDMNPLIETIRVYEFDGSFAFARIEQRIGSCIRSVTDATRRHERISYSGMALSI
jgi:hypothetical protein